MNEGEPRPTNMGYNDSSEQKILDAVYDQSISEKSGFLPNVSAGIRMSLVF